MRKMVKGKLVIKGILDPEDARLAIEHGADAIIVSNHGGRSMDYGPSTLEVLPEIVAAVNGRIPVIFDSGIRRGADIFKALALGANAVMIGRAYLWGLAVAGQSGVENVLDVLRGGIDSALLGLGKSDVKELDRTDVVAPSDFFRRLG